MDLKMFKSSSFCCACSLKTFCLFIGFGGSVPDLIHGLYPGRIQYVDVPFRKSVLFCVKDMQIQQATVQENAHAMFNADPVPSITGSRRINITYLYGENFGKPHLTAEQARVAEERWDNELKTTSFDWSLLEAAEPRFQIYVNRNYNITWRKLTEDIFRAVDYDYEVDLDQRIRKRKQQKRENPLAFVQEMVTLTKALDRDVSESHIVRNILQGMLPEIAKKLGFFEPRTIKDIEKYLRPVMLGESYRKSSERARHIPQDEAVSREEMQILITDLIERFSKNEIETNENNVYKNLENNKVEKVLFKTAHIRVIQNKLN